MLLLKVGHQEDKATFSSFDQYLCIVYKICILLPKRIFDKTVFVFAGFGSTAADCQGEAANPAIQTQ